MSVHPKQSVTKPLPEIKPAARYTEPAPADEVMMEQLAYLMLHARTGLHVGCLECARLDKIRAALLSPFS